MHPKESGDPLNVAIDTCAVDAISATPGAEDTLYEAVVAGRLRLFFTHVQLRELSNITDPEIRLQRLLTLVRLGTYELAAVAVLTEDGTGCILGHTKLGDPEVYESMVENATTEKHVSDGIIAATAGAGDRLLLTAELKRVRNRGSAAGLTVVSVAELLHRLT
jgi:hypothetical protein